MTDNDGNDHAAPKQGTTHIDFSGDLGKIHDGDAALALFDNLDEIHEGFEPGEEKRIVRKIDLMILPFLSVCYAFYYLAFKCFLYWLPGFELPDEFVDATVFYWKIFWSQPLSVGIFFMLQAAARNFTQLAILRVISVAAEACSDPAFMLITSM
ncbi:uncharacterized protein N7529_010612 [Penicillium soppii]|uniref:uncharacterized protein n=1 Tax=Penicillium soppii TaxID=69789 RepID=UPI0025472DF1|nr:uncharacterized protein N7529_010612 [Penicillium soppii]KAJ5856668.1 hypothetical protein N7529_010612 [Penicillium soppii]